jgi:hypothetical protein
MATGVHACNACRQAAIVSAAGEGKDLPIKDFDLDAR